MYDLASFALNEAILSGAALRQVARGASSLEDASRRVARFFYEQFIEVVGHRSAFVLARCYKTHPLAGLPPELAAFARGVFPGEPLRDETACLTLLSTFGDAPAWRSRQQSSGHQAIPLVSERIVESLPMVARLTASLGLEARDLVSPDPALLLEKARAGFDVFHVEHAPGSPYIPAQDFVRQHGVRSVVGFGFVLPPAHVFATILFARQDVPPERAELFKTLALNLKLALLPLSYAPVFAGS